MHALCAHARAMSIRVEECQAQVITLRIGMPNGQVEKVSLQGNARLSSLIEEIRERISIDPTKTRIRLIAAGRLLADVNASITSLLAENDFVHCALSDAQPPGTPEETSSPQPAVVITAGAPGEVRIVLHDLGESATERLTDAGFTSAEASALTVQLRRVRAEMQREMRSRDRDLGGTDEATAFTVASSVEGTNTDFLMGCVCGYLLGVLVLGLLLDKNITRRWRFGIVAGVATNCAFGILRTTLVVQGAGALAT